MSSCRGGIGKNATSQLSSSDLLTLTRDTTQFFGQRGRRFRSASEAQAYRKMLTIASGVNGPWPVPAPIQSLQAALPCRLRSMPVVEVVQRAIEPILKPVIESEQEIEPEPDIPIEDLSLEITPLPAQPPEIVREARLDALWELHTYAAPPKTRAAGPSFGGATVSGDISIDGSTTITTAPFFCENPMRAAGQTT
jgi:hypothetical protein